MLPEVGTLPERKALAYEAFVDTAVTLVVHGVALGNEMQNDLLKIERYCIDTTSSRNLASLGKIAALKTQTNISERIAG